MLRTVGLIGLIALLGGSFVMFQSRKAPPPLTEDVEDVYGFKVKDIDGKEVSLKDYEGKVLLIVNVASKCGLTDSNYKKLEPLYAKYKEKGLRILAFPCNNFMGQEPGTASEIKQFCTTRYNATYDLFSKVEVEGKEAAPLYRYLTNHPNEKIAGPVTWNFQKYVVGRDGKALAKFGPRTAPDAAELIKVLESALAKPVPGTSAVGTSGG